MILPMLFKRSSLSAVLIKPRATEWAVVKPKLLREYTRSLLSRYPALIGPCFFFTFSHIFISNNSHSRPAPGQPRRSLSQDSGAPPMTVTEKAKAAHRKPPTKRGSSHADVIDRLDFSGVGPSMYHSSRSRFPHLFITVAIPSVPP